MQYALRAPSALCVHLHARRVLHLVAVLIHQSRAAAAAAALGAKLGRRRAFARALPGGVGELLCLLGGALGVRLERDALRTLPTHDGDRVGGAPQRLARGRQMEWMN